MSTWVVCCGIYGSQTMAWSSWVNNTGVHKETLLKGCIVLSAPPPPPQTDETLRLLVEYYLARFSTVGSVSSQKGRSPLRTLQYSIYKDYELSHSSSPVNIHIVTVIWCAHVWQVATYVKHTFTLSESRSIMCCAIHIWWGLLQTYSLSFLSKWVNHTRHR